MTRLNKEEQAYQTIKDWHEERARDLSQGSSQQWEDIAWIVEAVQGIIDRGEAPNRKNRRLAEALAELMRPFPYDEKAWAELRQFVPAKWRASFSGKKVTPLIHLFLVVDLPEEQQEQQPNEEQHVASVL